MPHNTFKHMLGIVGTAVAREMRGTSQEWSPDQLKEGVEARLTFQLKVEKRPPAEEGGPDREVVVVKVGVTPLAEGPAQVPTSGFHEVVISREAFNE